MRQDAANCPDTGQTTPPCAKKLVGEHQSVPRRPLVLIVDDHEDAVQMHDHFLSMDGFDTCSTTASLDALEIAVRRRPDVILTDIRMPFVDGWTIVRTLKEHPLTEATPVVVLTGDTDVISRRRGDGCEAFLQKPCPLPVVAETLRAVLEQRAAAAASRQ